MQEDAVQIRAAAPRDFLGIAALDRVAWRANRQSGFIPDGEHVWRVWCEHALTFVALRGEEIVGVILAFPCNDGTYCLHKVMVDASVRKRGIASRLFEALLAHTDRHGIDLFLTVDPANDKALGLYAKWGFERQELVRGYYRDNEDRYVLVRSHRSGL